MHATCLEELLVYQFASYLYTARGSSKETRTHLHVAATRGHISAQERDALQARYVEVEKMATGLILTTDYRLLTLGYVA